MCTVSRSVLFVSVNTNPISLSDEPARRLGQPVEDDGSHGHQGGDALGSKVQAYSGYVLLVPGVFSNIAPGGGCASHGRSKPAQR